MQQLSIRLPEMPLTVTPEQFAAIAAENRDLRLERTATGELIANPPTGWETSVRNNELVWQLTTRAKSYGGLVLESSGGCTLLGGATRSPDAAWVSEERLAQARNLPRVPGGYFPLCPDFVAELRSASDGLTPLQSKMQEYRDSGARLGWLIDPQNRRVEIYRPGRAVEIQEQPAELLGEDVLPRFVLKRAGIW